MKLKELLRNAIDFAWPTVGKPSDDDALSEDLKTISEASWDTNAQIFLDEARRLRDVENRRKASAETKAQIYLGALLALVPICISLAERPAFQRLLSNLTWHGAISISLFSIGALYGVGAFVSAFRSINVRAYHRVDFGEIVEAGNDDRPVEKITKNILESVRRDRSSINHKISFLIATHQFIFRMALSFLASIGFAAFGSGVGQLISLIGDMIILETADVLIQRWDFYDSLGSVHSLQMLEAGL